ncbi:Ankyrin repeat domain containing protein, partial [Asbolus verrucosus]
MHGSLIKQQQNCHSDIVQTNPSTLHAAMFSKNKELIKANVNVQNTNGHGALRMTSINGDIKMTELLVKYGADVNIVDSQGRTPLHYAAYFGTIEIVQILIENGADRWCIKGSFLQSQFGNSQIVDTRGFTPLHTAAYYENTEIVKCLVENGANVNATDNDGRTPLQWSQHQGHEE